MNISILNVFKGKALGTTCTGATNECVDGLLCDTTCKCPTTQYWDGSTCRTRKFLLQSLFLNVINVEKIDAKKPLEL